MGQEQDTKEIIRKYINGQSNQEDLDKALSLFEEPYKNLILRVNVCEIWREIADEKQEQTYCEDFSNILDQIHHQINLSQDNEITFRRKKYVINILKVAAILLIGILTGFFANSLQRTETVYYTSIAPKGSVSQMILPDNTMVYLNAGSELKYKIDTDNDIREVFLEGEAWFDVTKNKNNSFIVHTPFYDVKVWGTEFNVKAYKSEEEVVTTLERGSIEILSSENLKLNKNRWLKPGQQLIYNQTQGTLSTKSVNSRIFTSWKDNKLIFINMNLKELLTLLERKFGIDIEVANNMILDYHYDGIIKDETILEVLDLLKETLPIQYKIEGQKVIILNNK